MATTTARNQTGENPWDKKELGVLWKKESKTKGEKYLTGTVNLKSLGFDQDVPVIIFSNKNKKKDTHPDLRIYLSERRDASAAPARPSPAVRPAVPAPAAPVVAPVQDDQELI